MLHWAISLKVVLGPNKMMKVKIFKYFYFWLQYALIIPLHDFDISVS